MRENAEPDIPLCIFRSAVPFPRSTVGPLPVYLRRAVMVLEYKARLSEWREITTNILGARRPGTAIEVCKIHNRWDSSQDTTLTPEATRRLPARLRTTTHLSFERACCLDGARAPTARSTRELVDDSGICASTPGHNKRLPPTSRPLGIPCAPSATGLACSR